MKKIKRAGNYNEKLRNRWKLRENRFKNRVRVSSGATRSRRVPIPGGIFGRNGHVFIAFSAPPNHKFRTVSHSSSIWKREILDFLVLKPKELLLWPELLGKKIKYSLQYTFLASPPSCLVFLIYFPLFSKVPRLLPIISCFQVIFPIKNKRNNGWGRRKRTILDVVRQLRLHHPRCRHRRHFRFVSRKNNKIHRSFIYSKKSTTN